MFNPEAKAIKVANQVKIFHAALFSTISFHVNNWLINIAETTTMPTSGGVINFPPKIHKSSAQVTKKISNISFAVKDPNSCNSLLAQVGMAVLDLISGLQR